MTTSRDCTIALWKVTPNAEAETVDLQPETFLFGHRDAITVIAVSSVLSLIVTADLGGRVLVWGLNTHELIREIELGRPAEVHSQTFPSLHDAPITHISCSLLVSTARMVI